MANLLTYLLVILSFSLQVYSQVVLEPTWSTVYAGKSAMFMPDGNKVITVGGAGATVWSTVTGKEHFTLLSHENPIDTIVISKSGARILTLSRYDSVVKLWDGNNGKLIQSIHYPARAILGTAISNNDMYVALGCSDGTVRIWNIEDKKEETIFEEHFNKVTAVTFSTTGDTLISGSSMVVLVWDRKTKKIIHTLDVSGGKVESVLINNKGDRIVAACSNGETSVWNAHSGVLEFGIPHNGRRYNNMTINSKGDKLLLLMDWYTYLMDLNTGEQINGSPITYADKLEQRYGSFSHSGTMYSETMGDSVVRIWDVETNKVIKEIRVNQAYFRHAFFSPTENKIITTNNSDIVELWDIDSLKRIHSFCGNGLGVLSFDINAEKKIMVTGSSAGSLKVWDLDSATLKYNFLYKNSHPTDVYVDVNGVRVIVNVYTLGAGTYMERSVDIWDIIEKKNLKTIKSTFDVTSGGFNNAGTKFTIYTIPNTVEIWETESLSKIIKTEGRSPLTKPIFMKNDNVVAQGDGGYVALFDGTTGQQISLMAEHGKPTKHGITDESIVINRQDSFFVCRQIDGSAIAKFHNLVRYYFPADASVSNNSKYSIFTESDTNAVIWNLQSNSIHKRIRGNSKGILGVFFTKDDTRCITYGVDSLIRIWSVKSGELIAALNAKTNFITDVKTDDSFTTVVARVRDGTMKKWDVSQVPTDVEENLQTNYRYTLQISPNPVNDNLNVYIDMNGDKPLYYNITNMYGQNMISNTIENRDYALTIPVQNLPPGMYIFSTELNGKRIHEKFIITK